MGEIITDEVKQKREYRKVKEMILDAINTAGEGGATLDEIIAKTNTLKWYCIKKLDSLVAKGLIEVVDGKYLKKEG